MEKTALSEIAKWCDLWLKGETDRKFTTELILGLRNTAKRGLEKCAG